MAGYFQYKKEGQQKYAQSGEPFLKNVPKERVFSLPSDKDSTTRGRILPPWSAAGAWALGSSIHWLGKQILVCPNTVERGTCPFCDVHFRIKGDQKFAADVQVIRPSKRFYANFLPEGKKENFLFSFGWNVYSPINTIQESGEYGDLTDPEHGRNLILARTVKGKAIKDSVYPAPNPSIIEVVEVLENLFDLDTILPPVDIEEVEKAFASHPWQVYEPRTSVQVHRQAPVVEKQDTVVPPTQVQQQATQPAPSDTPAGTVDESSKQAKLDALKAKLAARVA